MDAQTIVWPTSVPQFWYGVVACTSLVFLALLSAALFPGERSSSTVSQSRAPVPLKNPFYKPGIANRALPTRTDATLREHTGASPGRPTDQRETSISTTACQGREEANDMAPSS